MASAPFDRTTLLDAFRELGRAAWDEGATIEIAVNGGSALMLIFDWRVATKGVDGVFDTDRDRVRRLAAKVGLDRAWPDDWLNDGVRGFLSARDQEDGMKPLLGEFPSTGEPGLRVFVPRPEYSFAMKCRAMRLGGVDENRDIEDIRHLAAEIGIRTAAEAMSSVASFYPHALLQPKVQFGLEEIFSAEEGAP